MQSDGIPDPRLQAHGDRFNQTLSLVAGWVAKAERGCKTKVPKGVTGFAGKLRKFEAQYQCFKHLYANNSGGPK